jgi:hypothetical protein
MKCSLLGVARTIGLTVNRLRPASILSTDSVGSNTKAPGISDNDRSATT